MMYRQRAFKEPFGYKGNCYDFLLDSNVSNQIKANTGPRRIFNKARHNRFLLRQKLMFEGDKKKKKNVLLVQGAVNIIVISKSSTSVQNASLFVMRQGL